VSDEKTRHQNDLTQLEQRLVSAFQDPVTESKVMARTHRRLREAMLSGARPSRSRLASAFGPIAATMALVMVAGVVGWRLVGQRATTERPLKLSTSAKALPTVAAIDPLNCKLPVLVTLETGPPNPQLKREVGFIDTHTGHYARDGSASVAGLPGGGSPGTTSGKPAQASTPLWYSASLGRWLPVFPPSVSPDGRSYVWVRLLPEGSLVGPNVQQAELHRYDVVSSMDRTLWTYPGSINVWRWDASGILLNTVPPAGGVQLWWLVDARTGTAAQQAIAPGYYPRLTQLPGDPRNKNGLFDYSGFAFGAEFQGHTLFRIGSREPGSPDWVFYEIAPGQRVTIYRGTQGDARGFDPSIAMSDATGIWFSDYGGPWLWRWQQGSGLNRVVLSGLPSPLAGPNSSVGADPAGPCI
jgi:hypothetical protein